MCLKGQQWSYLGNGWKLFCTPTELTLLQGLSLSPPKVKKRMWLVSLSRSWGCPISSNRISFWSYSTTKDLVPSESGEQVESRKAVQEKKWNAVLWSVATDFRVQTWCRKEHSDPPQEQFPQSLISTHMHRSACSNTWILIIIVSRRIMSYEMSKTRSNILEECQLEIKPCFYWIADLLKAVIWNICRSLGSMNNCYLHISKSLQFCC